VDEWIDQIRYRETDRFVRTKQELGFHISPLSVSSDRIAYYASRCAGLLHQLVSRAEVRLDRLGDCSGVFEVCPAVALAAWGLPHKGYKSGSRGSQKSTDAETCRRPIVTHSASTSNGRGFPLTLSRQRS
jgi:hypothetical protein